MTVKEFLLRSDSPLNLAEIARQMWPTNKNAVAYISQKLSERPNSRPWTESDSKRCIEVLKKLAVDIQGLEP